MGLINKPFFKCRWAPPMARVFLLLSFGAVGSVAVQAQSSQSTPQALAQLRLLQSQ